MSKITHNSTVFAFTSNSIHFYSEKHLDEKDVDILNATRGKSIDCLSFSPCGNLVAFCCEKELYLFKIWDKILATTTIEKTAMSVKFFNTRKIILVAEKNGCVAFYSYENSEVLVKTTECLGHNSIITDALITDNDKFVITADRDEKIRVSHYPNTYNIQSYCLGHSLFVSSLSFLPDDHNILVSTSGDGTLRLWNYMEGKQLAIFKDRHPLIKSVSSIVDSNVIIALQKYQSTELDILTVCREDNNFTIDVKQTISTPSVIFDINVFDGTILYLMDQNPAINVLDLSSCSKLNQVFFDELNERLSKLPKIKPDFDSLFRKEFNNVDIYLEKKRARIAEKAKINKMK